LIRAAAPDFQMGANGIAFQPPRTLFVANANQARIARIAIDQSGARAERGVVASGPALLTVDGLTLDMQGFLCAVVAVRRESSASRRGSHQPCRRHG
jgi:sugar lactone lactonase YvrE